MTHKVKLLSAFYEPVIEGRKPFEIRYNDRDYKKGDGIMFQEWNGNSYTGRYAIGFIKDVFDISFLFTDYVAFTFELLDHFEV